ncbi:MAG: hypothetical protein OT477_14850 [Chloroflexi bacterium]|nr:hypothetical protein [Chloroflexota bacterium]
MITVSVVDSYRELQALNLQLVEAMQGISEGQDRAAMAVALLVMDTMLPLVPIDTGTLQAAQVILPEEGAGEVWITSAHLQNPKWGGYADQYVLDVVQRGDFYAEAVATTPEWVEEAFGAFEAWVGSLL